ncbi:hypothetical protein LCGC14_1201060 [marine sediment metagenome]|uniref:GDP-mannose 4,6-dehydratase n=1 Tax=marine sediment metagenome TaxID=412755 RepID=A0A0F9PLM3_9ZZZZ
MPTALITGITGQDGSYLAELLLAKGYEVHGIMRRCSSFTTGRIDHIYDQLTLYYGDMLDGVSLRRCLTKSRPDEVYNLACQSHVKTSFDQPVYSAESIAIGTINLLEAIRDYRDQTGIDVRFYQASSSEMFGSSPPPQNEDTPFRPRSPYACAKVHAHWAVVNYREAYGLKAWNGILFNHESPRRGPTFVTQKIAQAVVRIVAGKQTELRLGNLDAKRDWGYAPDYVQGMWAMLQTDTPDDYVLATGDSVSVQQFADKAFAYVDLKSADYIVTDCRYMRPTEVHALQGDANKAYKAFGWAPVVRWAELCEAMIDAAAPGQIGLNDGQRTSNTTDGVPSFNRRPS